MLRSQQCMSSACFNAPWTAHREGKEKKTHTERSERGTMKMNKQWLPLKTRTFTERITVIQYVVLQPTDETGHQISFIAPGKKIHENVLSHLQIFFFTYIQKVFLKGNCEKNFPAIYEHLACVQQTCVQVHLYVYEVVVPWSTCTLFSLFTSDSLLEPRTNSHDQIILDLV